MFDYIPLDIQTTIIKKLPVKSLIQFRCVSKEWKSLIDSSEFIKNYQEMNRHLLVRNNVEQNNLSIIDEYVSIIDNDAFPKHMSPITVPLSVKTLKHVRILGSSYGIICFHGYHKDYSYIASEMVVFWNPSIRKDVSVWLEPSVRVRAGWRVGFGVCPKTCDPKLFRIDDVGGIPEAQVYTLSTQAWKKVSLKTPYKPCGLMYGEGVPVERFIYWLACDDRLPPFGNGSKSIVSFDLTNEEFGHVHLPNSLIHMESLWLSKLNECLTVSVSKDDVDLNYTDVYVWMMKDDGVTQSFTVMFSIRSRFPIYHVVKECRKNGEAIIETRRNDYDDDYGYDDDDVDVDPILQVYDPCSGRINNIGIPWTGHNDFKNTNSRLSVSSYMETLLLLDH